MKLQFAKVPYLLGIMLMLSFALTGAAMASYTKVEDTVERIGPEDARAQAMSGKSLLVCAYDDDSCKSRMLDGGLYLSELEARLDKLPKNQPIIFYCG